MPTKPHFSLLATSFAGGPRPRNAALILAGLWLLIFFASLFSPPVLDDADATHAQAARAMATTGDLVTLRVDGVRYLEKAPLPYWLAAASFRIFGFNTFAAHLPQALAVGLLVLLGHRWANQAFGARTAFYTAIALLTSPGVFLFTRILIPEVLLSLLLAATLFAFLKSLGPVSSPSATVGPPQLRVAHASLPRHGSEPPHSSQTVSERPAVIPSAAPLYPYLMWTLLALAVLTKGLVALVFFLATTFLYLVLLGEFRSSLPKLRPVTGPLLLLAIAAPWHILAALRNPGFLRFYFWNEHVLRFLGRRIPADFNGLPGYLYWTLHLVWLFPWCLFVPLSLAALRRRMRHQTITLTSHIPKDYSWGGAALVVGFFAFIGAIGRLFRTDFLGGSLVEFTTFIIGMVFSRRYRAGLTSSPFHRIDPQQRTILLLSLFAASVLLFFSLSTNQEYYTFPAYLPLLLPISATITRGEQTYSSDLWVRRWITVAHAAFTAVGGLAALILLYGLWNSRHVPSTADIGALLTRRNVAENTLSLSHLFDLTFASFATLRLPVALAVLAFVLGPAVAWLLRSQRRHIAATTALAFTSAVFLVAAHIAFARFAPMLSSEDFAATIRALEVQHRIDGKIRIALYGDQSLGSSIPFYLGRNVTLVDARTTSMLFGSTFADSSPIFASGGELAADWGQGERKILFVPAEKRNEAERMLKPGWIVLEETSGKLLVTDRPLN